MSTQTKIKIVALFFGFASLVVAVVDERGGFRDATRIAFVAKILEPTEIVTPATPGFSKFYEAFPIEGVSLDDVIKIRRDRQNSHDGFPVALTVRYVLKSDRVTSVVADKAKINSWADESSYGIWSLIIAFAAFACVALLDLPEILEDWKKRKKEGAEPGTAPNGGPTAPVSKFERHGAAAIGELIVMPRDKNEKNSCQSLVRHLCL